MNATEIHIEKINCDDAGIRDRGAGVVPIDCLPSTGDFIEIDGITFLCEKKTIRMDHGVARVTLDLKTA